MLDTSDAALAQLSLAAYTPGTSLPAGFTAVADATVAPSLDATATYSGGNFIDGNSAALVTTGAIDGLNSLVIAFRGSDDREDSLNDLTGINADYADFADLIAWADAYAASGAVDQVVVTGHSLGGSLAQQYMATHPDGLNGATYSAVTFGSPGAQIAVTPDARVDNVVIADDPAVVLGTHRGEIGALLAADPALAEAAAERIAAEFPGDLTTAEVLATLPTLTTNYVNNGDLVLLAGDEDPFDADSLGDLAEGDAERHDPALYASLTAKAAANNVPSVTIPQSPTTEAEALALGVYGGQYPTGTDVSGTIDALVDAYALRSDVVPEVVPEVLPEVVPEIVDVVDETGGDVVDDVVGEITSVTGSELDLF